MNRIRHSPLPVLPWGKVLLSSLTALFLLAGVGARGTTRPSPVWLTEPIDSHLANKLLIYIKKPDYPPIAKVNFIEGAVKLEIRVSEKGRVVQTHVLKGEPLLAVAAMHAVQKWRYRPYVSKGAPSPFLTDVIVRFTLHSHGFWQRFPLDAEAFLKKQVRPPKVVAHPDPEPSEPKVPVKVLVDSKGKVLDVTPMGHQKPVRSVAWKYLQAWKFAPARWGALTVPWYITVQIPLNPAPRKKSASAAGH